MACPLGLYLFIDIGTCEMGVRARLRSLSGSTPNQAVLMSNSGTTSDNHANIYCVILMRYVKAARNHRVNICIHRQILRQHILLLDDDLFVVELNGGGLERCWLR